MKSRRYLILGVSVYLLALLFSLPASLFTHSVNNIHPMVKVSGLQGTVWQGRAEQVLIGSNLLQGLEWELKPWALLAGRLQLGLAYADSENNIQLDVAQGFNGVRYIRNVEGQLKPAFVQSFTPYRIPALYGTVVFEGLSVELEGLRPTQVEGRVQWSGATVELGQKIALGTLQLVLEQSDSGPRAVLSETSGKLTGEATAVVDEAGVYLIEARFTPTAQGRHLERHLGLVMRKQGDGSYTRTHKGRLP